MSESVIRRRNEIAAREDAAIQRATALPLRNTMDGQAIRGDDNATHEEPDALLGITPTTSSETTGERAKVSEQERDYLRYASPEQLIAFCQRRLDNHLFSALLIVRTINALISSRTQLAPDEHWQSVEIAHRIVFGYGWTTWEWTDRRLPSEHVLGAGWGNGPIRSALYPAVFVPVHWALSALRLDGVSLLRDAMPNVLQAVFAATTDWYMFRLARKLTTERVAWTALLCSLCSMYTFYTSTRTLSNSTEAALTIAALYYWPLSLREDSETDLVGDVPLIDEAPLLKAVTLFAASAALRPSNVLLSVPLFVMLMQKIALNVKSAATALEAVMAIVIVARITVIVGLTSAALLFVVDSLFYHRFTFTPLGFLKRNVIQGISLFYGASPLHFYITSALPFITFTMLPYTLRGLWFACKRPPISTYDPSTRRWTGYRGEQDPVALNVLANAVLAFTLGMSFLGHKEVRFLQPIVPVLHIMQGYALALLPPIRDPAWLPMRNRNHAQRSQSTAAAATAASANLSDGQAALARQARQERVRRNELLQALTNFTSWQGRHHLLPRKPSWRSFTHEWDRLKEVVQFIRIWHGKTVMRLLLLNIVAMAYLSFHSIGQVRVAEYVGELSRTGSLQSVGYLMPCHSTPWMSHMHDAKLASDDKAWFITCEPPLNIEDKQDLRAYRDESDDFYDDPLTFLREKFGTAKGQRSWPSHLVMFAALLSTKGQEAPNGNANGDSALNVADYLAAKGYRVQRTFWNSLVHMDKRRRGSVVVMQRQTNK